MMNTIKKIILSVFTITVLIGSMIISTSASSYKDVGNDKYYSDSIKKLTTYGIVSGFDGNFRPEDNLTRAEFSKIISLISGLEDQVQNNLGFKKFNDVDISHWGTGYINTVANNKLIIGYTDGSFRPEKNVTYAEAVTVILRALNYSSLDLGDNWPMAYVAKADALGLTNNLKYNQNDTITRGDLCLVIDRALQTELNTSTSKLISKLDVTLTDEVLLIATKKEDTSLAIDEVRTNIGIYKMTNSCPTFSALSKAKLILNKDNEIIGLEDIVVPKSSTTTVDRIVNGEIYCENGTNFKKLGISDSTYVYYDGIISNFGTQKSFIEEGSAVAFLYDKAGNIEYLVVKDVNYTDAVTVLNDIYTAMNSVDVTRNEVDTATIIRDGYSATIDDIEVYDIAYYNRDNRTIYLYSDKISGTYNEAFPNKSNVTSIELSGNTFEIETQTAANKLGEKNDSYKIGSKITLLLGKNGKIADVVVLNNSDTSNYGILLSYSEGLTSDVFQEGKQENSITLINGEGKTLNYKVEKNYEEIIGCVVKISVNSKGYAELSIITNPKIVLGYIDKTNNKIGNHWLTNDCVIIEKISSPASANLGVSARVVELNDFIPNELTEKNVLHAVTVGEFEDISLIFVEDVLKTQYQYGILENEGNSSLGASIIAQYKVFSHGKSVVYSTSFYNKINPGTPVSMIISETGQLQSIKRIETIESRKTVEAVDYTRIKVNSNVYKIGDDFQIIKKSSEGYSGVAKNEIYNLKGKTVSLFADSIPESGGLVRMILVLD